MAEIDRLPIPGRWTRVVVNLVSIVILLSMMFYFYKLNVNAQSRATTANMASSDTITGLEIQQAATQQNVLANATKISDLQKDLDYQRDEIRQLQDSVSTIRGVGLGFGAIMTVFQFIQMLMQLVAGRGVLERREKHER